MVVSTLLTSTDIAALGSNKVVLPVQAGNYGDTQVNWTAIDFEEGEGAPHIPADAWFLNAITPSAVVKARSSTDQLLYVANSTTVIADLDPVLSIQFDEGCLNITTNAFRQVQADPVAINLSALFTLPFVLGGGP